MSIRGAEGWLRAPWELIATAVIERFPMASGGRMNLHRDMLFARARPTTTSSTEISVRWWGELTPRSWTRNGAMICGSPFVAVSESTGGGGVFGVGVAVGVTVAVGVSVGVMVAVGVGVAVGRRAHTLGAPEHEYPLSIAHTDEHPSVLVEFPSSQVSPLLTYPSPQVGTVQIEVQISPSTTLPSSHSSRRPVWICPSLTTATSFVPSEEEVMEYQNRVLSRAVQLIPRIPSPHGSQLLLLSSSAQQGEPAVGQ